MTPMDVINGVGTSPSAGKVLGSTMVASDQLPQAGRPCVNRTMEMSFPPLPVWMPTLLLGVLVMRTRVPELKLPVLQLVLLMPMYLSAHGPAAQEVLPYTMGVTTAAAWAAAFAPGKTPALVQKRQPYLQ